MEPRHRTAYATTLLACLAFSLFSLFPEGSTPFAFIVLVYFVQALVALIESRRPREANLKPAVLALSFFSLILLTAPLLSQFDTLIRWRRLITPSGDGRVTFVALLADSFTDTATCRLCRPTFASWSSALFWTLGATSLGYSSAVVLTFVAPFLMSTVAPKERYCALAVFAVFPAVSRFSCRLLAFGVEVMGFELSNYCFIRWLTLITLGASVIVYPLCSTNQAEGDGGSTLTCRQSRLSSRASAQDSDALRSHKAHQNCQSCASFTKFLASENRQFTEPLLSPSALDPSDLPSPSSIRSSPTHSPAVKRYMQRSRWDLVGVCLPFALFMFIHIGYGTYGFLIKPVDKKIHNVEFLVVEMFHMLSYGVALGINQILVPKLALFYQSVIACFVWFGMGVSLYSCAHTEDGLDDDITNYPGATLFYNCVFRLFSSGQLLTLMVVVLEAGHSRVRNQMYCYAFASGSVGAICGIYASQSNTSPSTTLIITTLIMLMFTHVLRVWTPSMSVPHATLGDIDLRTACRFGDSDSASPPRISHNRRPSLRSVKSRASASHLSNVQRQTIANFI